MATRTRVISQNKAVYVSPTGWGEYSEHSAGHPVTGRSMIDAHQLHRVDTFSFEMDLAGSRQDVREFGQLARIGTINLEEINPTLSFGYYLGDGENELNLGFHKSQRTAGSGQMCSGQLSEDPILGERNVYLLTVEEGKDAFALDTSAKMIAAEDKHDVIGFGNCFLSSYSANFSVGEIPRADIEMQASNIIFYTGLNSGLRNPSLNLEGVRTHSGTTVLPSPNTGTDVPLVLRPQDVSVTFSDAGDGVAPVGGPSFSALPIQSASIELPLSREVIQALGNELAYAKLLEFPIDVTMSISSLTRDFASGALEFALTGTAENNKTDIALNITEPGKGEQLKFELMGAVLDNQSFSQGLDDNETVDLTFSAQIGGADTVSQGLFFCPQESVATPTFDVRSGTANKESDQPVKIV
tara:strand:- start:510 stop:1745 length:1236 start_codon:yes stop_codon:yes gene_type:complete